MSGRSATVRRRRRTRNSSGARPQACRIDLDGEVALGARHGRAARHDPRQPFVVGHARHRIVTGAVVAHRGDSRPQHHPVRQGIAAGDAVEKHAPAVGGLRPRVAAEQRPRGQRRPRLTHERAASQPRAVLCRACSLTLYLPPACPPADLLTCLLLRRDETRRAGFAHERGRAHFVRRAHLDGGDAYQSDCRRAFVMSSST